MSRPGHGRGDAPGSDQHNPPIEANHAVSALAAEVLEEWREGERLLRLLEPESSDGAAVTASIEEMRELYQHLTRAVPETDALLLRTAERIERTRYLLRNARDRLNADRGT